MKKVFLKDYISKKFKHFNSQFKDVIKSPSDEEAIHDLRTSIKKIKAVLKFVHIVNEDFKYGHHYQPFRNLFQEIGNTRDVQIFKRLISNKLGKDNNESIKSSPDLEPFKKAFSNGVLKKTCKEIDNALAGSHFRKDTKHYLKERLNEVSSLLNLPEKIREEKLHTLRKRLKELNYNLVFLRKYPEMTYKGVKIDRWLNKILTKLGDWHDIKSGLLKLEEKTAELNSKLLDSASKTGIKKSLKQDYKKVFGEINHLCNDEKSLGYLLKLSQNF